MEFVKKADEAFAQYDIGDMIVKDTGAWQDQGDNEWSMPVFIENGNEPSIKLTFVVKFDESGEVRDAYFAG